MVNDIRHHHHQIFILFAKHYNKKKHYNFKQLFLQQNYKQNNKLLQTTLQINITLWRMENLILLSISWVFQFT